MFDEDNISRDDFIGHLEIEFDENGVECPGEYDENGFKMIERELKDKDGIVLQNPKTPSESIKLKLQIRIKNQKVSWNHQANPGMSQGAMMDQPMINQQQQMGQPMVNQLYAAMDQQQQMGQPMVNQPYTTMDQQHQMVTQSFHMVNQQQQMGHPVMMNQPYATMEQQMGQPMINPMEQFMMGQPNMTGSPYVPM